MARSNVSTIKPDEQHRAFGWQQKKDSASGFVYPRTKWRWRLLNRKSWGKVRRDLLSRER
jgi:hypothetical protein